MPIQVVILAAGKGTRLARALPKTLTELDNGQTILRQQVDNLQMAFGDDFTLTVVVGFNADLIKKHLPSADFVHNQEFETTNTSKSLLKAFEAIDPGGVLWMNGDVVFDYRILHLLRPHIENDNSTIAVNMASVSEEEIKYTLDNDGFIDAISKSVAGAIGEAVGINYVSAGDRSHLSGRLAQVEPQAYFEAGIELTIREDYVRYIPIDIGPYYAVEVDFHEDLSNANAAVSRDAH